MRLKILLIWTCSLMMIMAMIALNASAQQRDGVTKAAKVDRSVAVTFDDLPASVGGFGNIKNLTDMTNKLVKSIRSNGVPAIGFVNEEKLHQNDQLAERTALLQIWLDAGIELGNHTYSHPYFYKMPLAEFEDNVVRGETVTAALLAKKGMKLRYFRHPFLSTGPDLKTKEEFEKFLAQRGYRVAPVTIDNMEWLFAKVYTEAKQRGDEKTMQQVVDAYIPYMSQVFQFYEQLSLDLLGREIPQVLLLHANPLNADHFDDLVAMMKQRGYRFVSLDEALTDKAYQLPDTYTGPVGISWLQRWAITKGMKFRKEPYLPEFMKQYDNEGASGSNFKSDKK